MELGDLLFKTGTAKNEFLKFLVASFLVFFSDDETLNFRMMTVGVVGGVRSGFHRAVGRCGWS